MNVDVTVLPNEYRALVAHYPKVINGSVHDISKRRLSRLLVQRDSQYTGPVIVKTDANSGGRVDQWLRRTALSSGRPSDIVRARTLREYRVYSSPGAVPEYVWKDSALIVERFVPERDEHGYYSRHWIFLGDRERSLRYRADDPLVRPRHVLERKEVPLPDEIRQYRELLAFDFGQFDYVRHNGEFLLLDVNRTPGRPDRRDPGIAARTAALAEGIGVYLPQKPAGRRRPFP